MVYDLFTSADFCYSKFSILNMLVWFLGLMWFFWNVKMYFFSKTRLKSMLSFLLKWHYDNMKSNIMFNMKGSYLIFSGLFLIMLGSNMWGLFPYVFGMTTQMVLTFSMSLMIWLGMVMSSIEFSMVGFLSHLTPQGSPNYLAPILKLIELVSNIMRPLTLALRLSINMTTGHVLMSLMSTSGVLCFFSSYMLCGLLVMLMMGYLLFEVGICFIQGFVFSLLSAQYLGEHT